MSIKNSIELYLPAAVLAAALESVSEISRSPRHGAVIIECPSGKRVQVPARTNDKQVLSTECPVAFQTDIEFPFDAAIGRHLQAPDEAIDFAAWAAGSAVLGPFDVEIRLGCKYVRFEFSAVLHDLSWLITESDSIRQTFLQIMRANDGALGVISLGAEPEWVILDRPNCTISDSADECYTEQEREEMCRTGYADVDRTLEILLHKASLVRESK